MSLSNMIHKYKYIILLVIVIISSRALVTQLLNSIFFNFKLNFKEGFTTTVDNILYGNITYNPDTFNKSNSNINTKLINEYSHTVNLPLNDSQGCQNACYNAKCSKTGKQCSTDADCYEDGCVSLLKKVQDQIINEQMAPLPPQTYVPADTLATGRLIYNQNPQYSSLTYDEDKENIERLPAYHIYYNNVYMETCYEDPIETMKSILIRIKEETSIRKSRNWFKLIFSRFIKN